MRRLAVCGSRETDNVHVEVIEALLDVLIPFLPLVVRRRFANAIWNLRFFFRFMPSRPTRFSIV